MTIPRWQDVVAAIAVGIVAGLTVGLYVFFVYIWLKGI